MKTLAARCVQLLNTDPVPSDRALIAHVPKRVDIELAAQKLLATAARQGQTLTITRKPRKGAPGHYTTHITVEDV